MPPPAAADRKTLLVKLRGNRNWDLSEAQLEQLTERTRGFTGADLEALCQCAGSNAAIRDSQALTIVQEDFIHALQRVRCSVSVEEEQRLRAWSKKT